MKKYILVMLCLSLLLGVCGCRKKDVYFEKPTMAPFVPVVGIGTPNDNTETKEELPTYTLAQGVIDSNPGVYGERYTYISPGNVEYSMVLQQDAPKTVFDSTKLKKSDNKYEYYSADGKLISKWGIDVSKYQGNINWKKVKDAGVEFVIIRLGYRGYGWAGKIVYDENFTKNIEGALNAGIEVGVYFFSQAINDAEALEEAQFVLDAIKKYNITYPVVFDTEAIADSLNPRTKNITRERVTKNCQVFCDAIEAAGYDSMIYYNMPWCAKKLDLAALKNYTIWYADYLPFPQTPYIFNMWQYTGTGRIDGIEGDVDINIYIKEY